LQPYMRNGPPRRMANPSVVTTPTSNAAGARYQQQQQQQQQQQHNNIHNSPMGSPMKPLNLSHISPQDTVSLLTTTPDREVEGIQNVVGGASTASPDRPHHQKQQQQQQQPTMPTGYSYSNISSTNPNTERPPSLAQDSSRRISHSTTGSATKTTGAILSNTQNPAYRQQLTQLVQSLQSNLTSSQQRTEEQEQLLGGKDLQLQQIEKDYYNLQQSYQKVQQQLQEQTRLSTKFQHQAEAATKQVESLEEDVTQLQAQQEQLQEQSERAAQEQERFEQHSLQQARALAKERQQGQELQQQWLQVQKSQMQDLETTYEQQQDEFTQLQHELDDGGRHLHQERQQLQEQEESLVAREEQVSKKQRQLAGWEEQMDQKQQVLEERFKEMAQQEVVTRHKVQEVQRLEATLSQESHDLDNKKQSLEAQHILMDQALEELMERRTREEQRLHLASQNLEEVQAQSRKIRADSKTVKEALKAKMATSHADYSRLASEIVDKELQLETLQKQMQAFVQEELQTRQLAEERGKQQMDDLERLTNKMEEVRMEMLIDEEAIVEQRKEHSELLGQVQDDAVQWERSKHERVQLEENENAARRSQTQTWIEEQIKRAKEELVSLGQFMATQNESMASEYEKRISQMNGMRENLEAATKQYKLDKAQLERDITDYAAKRKQLDQIIVRLDSSEKQYKDRQGELEWEVARLNTLVEAERRSHGQMIDDQDELLIEAHTGHRDQFQEAASRIAALEAERAHVHREYNALQSELEKVQNRFSVEIEALKGIKETLEEELADALEKAESTHSDMLNLKENMEDRKLSESVEREKIQSLMHRLDQTEAALAQKQKRIASQDELVKEASLDLESRLNELIRAVRFLGVVESTSF
jgi:hypothetical protein